MEQVIGYSPQQDGIILTPGRTDRKIIKGLDPQPNEKYRSKVGILNWLTMGIRMDLVYITKELSRVLAEPTKIANELVDRALEYTVKTKDAHLVFSHKRMTGFIPPPTRKKPTDNTKDKYDVQDYVQDDGIKQEDDQEQKQEYEYKGEQITVTCQTDIDLAGQVETRQSTSGYIIYLNGVLVHYRAATERLIIQSTAAGEYIALSRGNTATKSHIYYLYTDNQAAEHIATQPNMNEHSRSIDIRHHAIRQDYVDGMMRIGGVDSHENTSDILTKFLQPPLHQRHTQQLHIQRTPSLSNTTTSISVNATHATKNKRGGRKTNNRRSRSTRATHQTPPQHYPRLQLRTMDTVLTPKSTNCTTVHQTHRHEIPPNPGPHVAQCHHAHGPRFLAPTTQGPRHPRPYRVYTNQDKTNSKTALGPSQLTNTRNFEHTWRRGEATLPKYLSRKYKNFPTSTSYKT